MLVLSSYLNGEGATELRRTAAALNLRSYKSCTKMYHKTSKNYVAHTIIKEARAVVYECLIEEIHQSFLEKYPYLGDSEWQQFHSKLTAHTANLQSCGTQQDTNNPEYLTELRRERRSQLREAEELIDKYESVGHAIRECKTWEEFKVLYEHADNLTQRLSSIADVVTGFTSFRFIYEDA